MEPSALPASKQATHTSHSYLVRLWRGEGGVWRVWVENIRTRERHLLAAFELLDPFFERETADTDDASREPE